MLTLSLRRFITKSSPLSPLESLPTEIIHEIKKYLPIVSIIALSLCSKTLLSRFGTRYFNKIENGTLSAPLNYLELQHETRPPSSREKERRELLEMLARDSQKKWYFCQFCQMLCRLEHLIQEANGATRGIFGENVLIFQKIFQYSEIFMMVVEYRSLCQDFNSCIQKKELHWSRNISKWSNDLGVKLENMLVEEVKYNYRKGRTVQTIRTPRLVAGKFMLRTQMWIFLPKKSNSGKMELGWTLCPHIRALEDTRTRTFGILGKDLRCRAQHFESPGEAKGCSNCGEVKQCQLCQTEYQLNGMHFGKLGVAVVVSSWRNFGEIRTPFDPIWLAHHQVVPNEIVDFSPGSIKETFEGGKNYRFDAGRGKHLNKALTARYSEEKFEDGF